MRTLRVQELVWIAVAAVLVVMVLAATYTMGAVLDEPPADRQAAVGLAADVAFTWLGVAGVITLLGYWIPAYALTPLRTATEKVRSIGQGALDERVAPEGLAELRELAVSLNEMAGSLTLREQRLLHHERLAAVDVLLAGVAHEINNPLTFLRLNEDMVLRDARRRLDEAADASEADKDRLRRIVHALDRNLEGLQRLQRIVELLREISPKQETEPGRHDVNRIVEGVVVLLQHRTMYGTTVELDLQAASKVDALGFEVSHILLVLLTNAAEAVAGAGTVRVRTRDEDGSVVIDVDDTGPGIPAAVRDRLFEPHVTTKPNASGLGLATARSLAESMGGTLTGQNRPDVGARFSLCLPASDP